MESQQNILNYKDINSQYNSLMASADDYVSPQTLANNLLPISAKIKSLQDDINDTHQNYSTHTKICDGLKENIITLNAKTDKNSQDISTLFNYINKIEEKNRSLELQIEKLNKDLNSYKIPIYSNSESIFKLESLLNQIDESCKTAFGSVERQILERKREDESAIKTLNEIADNIEHYKSILNSKMDTILSRLDMNEIDLKDLRQNMSIKINPDSAFVTDFQA